MQIMRIFFLIIEKYAYSAVDVDTTNTHTHTHAVCVCVCEPQNKYTSTIIMNLKIFVDLYDTITFYKYI